MLSAICMLMLAGVACVPLRGEYPSRAMPRQGSSMRAASERGAVLSVVDAAVAKDVGQPVRLDVESVSIRPPFAAVVAVPLSESGQPIGYSATQSSAVATGTGAFDGQVAALLKYADGEWEILEYERGATDFPGSEWAGVHGAPPDIFE